MTLLFNTALSYNDVPVNYEILLTGSFLLFKPYFYHLEEKYPCIILTRSSNGWKLEQKCDKVLEEQIMDDIQNLRIT